MGPWFGYGVAPDPTSIEAGTFLTVNTQNVYRERTSRSGSLALNSNSFVDLCNLRDSFIFFNKRLGDLASTVKNMHVSQSGFPGLRRL